MCAAPPAPEARKWRIRRALRSGGDDGEPPSACLDALHVARMISFVSGFGVVTLVRFTRVQLPPASPLPWYPDNLAWTLDASTPHLKKVQTNRPPLVMFPITGKCRLFSCSFLFSAAGGPGPVRPAHVPHRRDGHRQCQPPGGTRARLQTHRLNTLTRSYTRTCIYKSRRPHVSSAHS